MGLAARSWRYRQDPRASPKVEPGYAEPSTSRRRRHVADPDPDSLLYQGVALLNAADRTYGFTLELPMAATT